MADRKLCPYSRQRISALRRNEVKRGRKGRIRWDDAGSRLTHSTENGVVGERREEGERKKEKP